MRGEPGVYNRYVEASAYAEVLTTFTHGKLVRVNRSTDELEPWLAESWTQSPDGLSYTIKLRRDVKFSDGAPLSSADVLFSFRALYDDRIKSPLASGIAISGRPLAATAPDPTTVVVTLPAPLAPGLRVLDNLPILPRHKLESALERGEFAEAWTPTKPLTDIAGLGPFVLTEHLAGQRMVFDRNPYYWRRDQAGVQLPYLDRVTVLVIPDQTTEALRLEAGEIDIAANADIRPEDYVRFKQRAKGGALRLIDVGLALDINQLWFNLTPGGAIVAKPALVKPNADEAAQVTGQRVFDVESAAQAAAALAERGIPRVVITLGPQGAVAAWDGRVARFGVAIDTVDADTNAVGSGDCFVAALAVGLAHQRPVDDTLRLAAACGAANALSSEPGFFRVEEAERLKPMVKVEWL